jgi:hypothetical protein
LRVAAELQIRILAASFQQAKPRLERKPFLHSRAQRLDRVGGFLAQLATLATQPQHDAGEYPASATPAEFIGYVKAPDEEQAIKEAIKEFEISDPEKQKRLVARRVR